VGQAIKWPSVMTLEEAARYLRLPKIKIAQLAAEGIIPARRIGDAWRFLKSAVDDWLQPHKNSWEMMREQIGVFAHDETLPALRKTIYQARGRPEVDNGIPQ